MDARSYFANSAVVTAPSPAISGTTLTVRAGDGVLFPAAPFNAAIIASGAVHPVRTEAEVVQVANVSTDTLTIVRAQGTSARPIVAGDRVVAGDTNKALTDIETALVLKAAKKRPLFWFQGTGNAIALPDGIWTPIPWNTLQTDPFTLSPGFQTLSTTVAAGSNGATLPTATINVASTAGFPTQGYIVITGPPGASVDTVVGYTGTTGTSFTGCNSTGTLVPTAGISTGTLATGQVVKGANCRVQLAASALWVWTAEAAFAANDTGFRRIRFRDGATPFFFSVAQTDFVAMNVVNQNVQVTMQPLFPATTFVEIYQSSGGVLNMTNDGIQAPQLMGIHGTDV